MKSLNKIRPRFVDAIDVVAGAAAVTTTANIFNERNKSSEES